MLNQQNSVVTGNEFAPIGEPAVMSEDEFLIAVSMLNHSERMEFLRCMDATH